MSSSPPVSNAYLIETSVFEAVTAITCIFSALLFLSSTSKFAMDNFKVAASKRFFHFNVLICSLLNVVKSIDNQQVLNRFNNDSYIIIFITNNITALLMLCGAVLIYNTIDVQYRINKEATPKTLLWLLVLLSILNFIWINIFTALAVIKLKQLYYIYVLYWMCASFTILLIMSNVSVYNVRKMIQNFHHSSTNPMNKKSLAQKSLEPLYYFVIFLDGLLLLVMAALIYSAYRIDANGLSDSPPDRASPDSWRIDVIAWVHVITISIYLWWSYSPLYILPCVRRRLVDRSSIIEVATPQQKYAVPTATFLPRSPTFLPTTKLSQSSPLRSNKVLPVQVRVESTTSKQTPGSTAMNEAQHENSKHDAASTQRVFIASERAVLAFASSGASASAVEHAPSPTPMSAPSPPQLNINIRIHQHMLVQRVETSDDEEMTVTNISQPPSPHPQHTFTPAHDPVHPSPSPFRYQPLHQESPVPSTLRKSTFMDE